MERANLLYDPLYGPIGLDEREDKITRLPLMRRLRNISQMGLANLVFPSARHDRFSHSLGVLCIVTKMCDALFDGLTSDEIEDLRRTLRLAALLHDIGHYPLSHTIEKAYMETLSQAGYIADWNDYTQPKNPFRSLLDDVPKSVKRAPPSSEAHHENLAKAIVTSRQLSSLMGDINPRKLAAIITGDDASLPQSMRVLGQLLHSELDADRIDYLRRDATFSATCYGLFDVDFLLETLCQRDGIIGITPRGIRAAEQFLLARLFAYSQIVFHRWVVAFEYMAREVYKEMLREHLAYSYEQIVRYAASGADEFYGFTDSYFFSLLSSAGGSLGFPHQRWAQLVLRGERPRLAVEQEFVSRSFSELREKAAGSPLVARWDAVADSVVSPRWFFAVPSVIRLSNCADSFHESEHDEDYLLYLKREGIVVFPPGSESELLLSSKHALAHTVPELTYAVFRLYCDSEETAIAIRRALGLNPDTVVIY